MLRLKTDRDLERLSEFGFQTTETFNAWYFDFEEYKPPRQYSYLCVYKETREIDTSYVDLYHIKQMVDKLFELFEAGMVQSDSRSLPVNKAIAMQARLCDEILLTNLKQALDDADNNSNK